MRRRQGFTLVEMLVAVALVLFIMSILSAAFVAATGTFRTLKATGDMAEKLRATTQMMTRDLAADHFEGKKRLSDPTFWQYGPPQQGYFEVWNGSQGISEGADFSGISSFRSADHALGLTIKVRGNQMGDFLTAGPLGGGAQLGAGNANFGPPEARYQQNTSQYNYQWAEVVWFLVPQINPATGAQDSTVNDATTNRGPLALWTLMRRQRLAVPDNTAVPPAAQAGAAANFLEVSCWPNNNQLYFNNPTDLTVPQRRFNGGVLAGCPTLAQQGAPMGLAGADIQLTDVVSFDVRVMTPETQGRLDPFVTLFDPVFTNAPANGGYNNGNPNYGAAQVFDTWSSVNDGLNLPPNGFAQWNSSGQATSIPRWNGTTGPRILAVQVSIRVWDLKTNQTRQVTVVQAQ